MADLYFEELKNLVIIHLPESLNMKTIKEFDEKMKKTVGVVQQDLASLRTGRASPSLVDNIKVDMYGSLMPLKQLASVSVPSRPPQNT